MYKLLVQFIVLTLIGSVSAQDFVIQDVHVASPFNVAAVNNVYGVNVDVEYETTLPSGIRIETSPYYNGQSLSTLISSSITTVTGSGTVTNSFSLDIGFGQTALIDEVLVRVTDHLGATLSEFFIPCDIHVGKFNIWPSIPMYDQRDQMILNNQAALVSFFMSVFNNEFTGVELEIKGFYGDEEVTVSELPKETFGDLESNSTLVNLIGNDHTRIDRWVFRYRQSYPFEGEWMELVYPVNWLWAEVIVGGSYASSTGWPFSGTARQVEFDYIANLGRSADVRLVPKVDGVPCPIVAPVADITLSGNGDSSFTYIMQPGNEQVDEYLFEFRDATSGNLEYDYSYPARVIFGDLLVSDLVYSIPSPARIRPGVHSVHVDFNVSNDHPFPVRVIPIPAIEYSTVSGGLDIGGDSFAQMGSSQFRGDMDREQQSKLYVTNTDLTSDTSLTQYVFPVDYLWADDYINPCKEDGQAIPAPVDLTKSFRPVPYPSGNVDRVQVKWYKDSPELRYPPQDEVGCDIQFWPIRDLFTNTPIIGTDSVMIADVTKPGKELFKWPIKFRKNGVNNSKRVEPSTRYNWRVRCACNEGQGPESAWSDIKIFNTPAFDPSTGIYIPPAGHLMTEEGKVQRIGSNPISVKVFPNPASSQLTIVSLNGAVLEEVEILDMVGKSILRVVNSAKGNGLQMTLDINDLPAGMYMLRASFGGTFAIEQILKQ